MKLNSIYACIACFLFLLIIFKAVKGEFDFILLVMAALYSFSAIEFCRRLSKDGE